MKKVILYVVLVFCASSASAELEIITLKHRSAEEILPIVRPLLDKDGVASGMNNQLILRTSSRNLAEIKGLLPHIDTQPRQLKISVMQNVDRETVKRLSAVSGSVGIGRNVRLRVANTPANGGLTVDVGQDTSKGRVQVISTRSLEDNKNIQQVQVVEGGRAFILVGKSHPVQQHSLVQTPWNVQRIDSTQYRDVSSGFYVSPLLNGDRVTLEISTQTDSVATASASTLVTWVQQLHTTLSGRLGEWMALGDTSQQKQDDGSTISTRSLSKLNERRTVLLKVEEMP